MHTHRELITEKARLLSERHELIKDHQDAIRRLDEALGDLATREATLIAGMNLERIDLAKTVLEVSGRADQCRPSDDGRNKSTRKLAIQDAINHIAAGDGYLKTHYVGVKNYDRFGDQREDHKYFLGPRHGGIVFSIGLKADARQRDLTADEIEAALYWLSVLHEYHAATAGKAA